MWTRAMRKGKARLLAAAIGLCGVLAGGRAWTGQADAKPFTWVVGGDYFEEPPKGLAEGMIAAKPALAVGTGDLIFRGRMSDFRTFKRIFIDPLKKIGAEYYPVIGNHDFPLDNWKKMWGPEKGKNYYSFDYGNAHFVVLDTNKAAAPDGRSFKKGSENYYMQTQGADFKKGSAQYRWLIQDLEKTRKKQLFAFNHHPVFSFGGHHGMPAIQKELGPVFEQYKFTAVFSGHSHGYERFKPIRIDLSSGRPKAVLDEKNGVTYIVTASGTSRGNLYDIKKNLLHASFKKAPHFIVLKVEGALVKAEVIQPPGHQVIDSFELKSRRP